MKKPVIVALAVLLVVVLTVGSAFAITPAYTKVSMPDPYGISLLSLDDSSTSRTLSSSGPFWFGKQGSAKEIPSFTNVYDNFNGSVRFIETQSSSYSIFAINIPSGTYFDFTSAVSYSSTDFAKLLVSGSVSFGLSFLHASSSIVTFPDTAQFLVNGLPVGDPVSISDNIFIFPTIEVEITSDISSVGYRFTYGSAKATSKDSSPNMSSGTDAILGISDDVSVTPIEVSDPYIPLLIANNSWLSSIYNVLQNISSGIGDGISRLASVFARDDDIQLRDDMDGTLKEATSIFYDSEENPDTAISSDTVSEAGETLKGVTSMFDSGYNATDAFQEIADSKDDFLSWFSEDTYNWLDTTPATYSREADPFNHWMIENQYAEMQRKRGEGD